MQKISNILLKAGVDRFMLALIFAIVLAYFFPALGIMEKPISLEKLSGIGVSGVFFFYGLKLNLKKLKQGIANWRMHLLIQLTTFVLFPVLILLIKPFFIGEQQTTTWMGLFFLAALPSTVSSSVVMVSIAGGNMAGAIFNASISAFVGVFITPIWIKIFLPQTSGKDRVDDIVLQLILQVLVPVILGLLLNKKWGSFAESQKNKLKLFDQVIILTIIYVSFSKSFSLGLFSNIAIWHILIMAFGMLALYFLVLFVIQQFSKYLGFNRSDTITSIFCGSKKSLVHGTVMSKVLFAGNPNTGILLLPLMIYHALQLIAAGLLAQQFARKGE